MTKNEQNEWKKDQWRRKLKRPAKRLNINVTGAAFEFVTSLDENTHLPDDEVIQKIQQYQNLLNSFTSKYNLGEIKKKEATELFIKGDASFVELANRITSNREAKKKLKECSGNASEAPVAVNSNNTGNIDKENYGKAILSTGKSNLSQPAKQSDLPIPAISKNNSNISNQGPSNNRKSKKERRREKRREKKKAMDAQSLLKSRNQQQNPKFKNNQQKPKQQLVKHEKSTSSNSKYQSNNTINNNDMMEIVKTAGNAAVTMEKVAPKQFETAPWLANASLDLYMDLVV